MSELNRQLGILIEGMAGVKDDIKGIREQMRDSEQKSAQSRSAMHRRLDDVVARTGALESDMRVVDTSIREVKAVTDKVTMWEQRGIGALFITGIGASSATWAVTHYFAQILAYFRHP